MAASNVICETSTPSLSPSTETKHGGGGGGRKSKKIITIDLSRISCLLNRRDDINNIYNTNNIYNHNNTYNTTQDEGKEETDDCMNNNIEDDVEGDVEGGKNGYYYRNREKKLEYQKNYNREQGDKIKNYNKDYYQKRREEILEKAKTKITCECGCEVQLFNMNSHKKTKKHAKALAAINGKIRTLAN